MPSGEFRHCRAPNSGDTDLFGLDSSASSAIQNSPCSETSFLTGPRGHTRKLSPFQFLSRILGPGLRAISVIAVPRPENVDPLLSPGIWVAPKPLLPPVKKLRALSFLSRSLGQALFAYWASVAGFCNGVFKDLDFQGACHPASRAFLAWASANALSGPMEKSRFPRVVPMDNRFSPSQQHPILWRNQYFAPVVKSLILQTGVPNPLCLRTFSGSSTHSGCLGNLLMYGGRNSCKTYCKRWRLLHKPHSYTLLALQNTASPCGVASGDA